MGQNRNLKPVAQLVSARKVLREIAEANAEDDAAPMKTPPALRKLQAEAAARGATLATGGEGGLSPEVVLTVMRRDGYKCKRCGGRAALSVHHKAKLENPSPRLIRLRARIPSHDPAGLVTICDGDAKSCHDAIHDADRAAAMS